MQDCDNKPFYLGHLNTWMTLVLSKFRLIVPSKNSDARHGRKYPSSAFPIFSVILNYTLSVGVIQH